MLVKNKSKTSLYIFSILMLHPNFNPIYVYNYDIKACSILPNAQVQVVD